MGPHATKSLPFRSAYSLLQLRPILPKPDMPGGLLMGMPIAGQFVSLELYRIRPGAYGAYRLRFSADPPQGEWDLRAIEALETMAAVMVTFGEELTDDRAMVTAMEFHKAWTSGELCPGIRKLRDDYPIRQDAAGMRWVGVRRL